ncbi:MAG: hypothetical protein E7324_03215 [Clostridiales bacterium]|nr:hypothetical protein [Clostridiales bacterium]
MNKILVLLLCVVLGAGMLTMSGMASQRNAWKGEAEKLEKQLKKAETAHDKEVTELEEMLESAYLERDAYALLQQTMEEEKAALSLQLQQAEERIARMEADLTAAVEMEQQLVQAHADKEWAEQRLQEALAVLMTPAPTQTPAPAPVLGNGGEESLFSAVMGALQPLAESQLTEEAEPVQENADETPLVPGEEMLPVPAM